MAEWVKNELKNKIKKEADVWLNLKYFNKQNENHLSQLNVDKGIVVEIYYTYRPYKATIRYL